jgi:hypothetical protein
MMVLPAWIAQAHSPRRPQDISGLAISPISHGQMAVIARHREAIEMMATWVAPKDRDISRLLSFSRKQHARCFWGLLPGSVEDEASPMNECSHAYLAADQAMLVRMRGLPFWQDKAVELFDRVEGDMIASGSSLVLCAFSASPFNTASLVYPDWHDFPTHLPSLLALLSGLALLLAGIGYLARAITREIRMADDRNTIDPAAH